jgi:hypothetical protein
MSKGAIVSVVISGLILCVDIVRADDATSYSALPDPAAPFVPVQKARQTAVLKVDHVIDRASQEGLQPYFEAGQKQVYFNRDVWRNFFKNPAALTIVNDGEDIATINCTGGILNAGSGLPFKGKDDEKGTVTADQANQTVTFTKEIAVSPAKTATFSYTLKNASPGSCN